MRMRIRIRILIYLPTYYMHISYEYILNTQLNTKSKKNHNYYNNYNNSHSFQCFKKGNAIKQKPKAKTNQFLLRTKTANRDLKI